MRRKRTQTGLLAALIGALIWSLVCAPGALAQDDDIANEYRLTLFPYHRISEKLTGFGYLGYVNNPDGDFQTAYLGWGVDYAPDPSVHIWVGLVSTYTNYEVSADKLELRPFIGVKSLLPNKMKWHIYNFTRYEDRIIENRNTHDWTETHRIRSRFGVEIPLTSREKAFKLKTWFGLVDVEAFYRFDKDYVDPLRVRCGIGRILSSRVSAELVYHAQYTRPAGSTGLEYTDNIFRLNIKLALNKGLLQRIAGGDADD
jgi:hypothetical protein